MLSSLVLTFGAAAAAGEPFLTYELGAPSYGGASAADLDGDGDLEVAFGTYYHDERVVALHHDGGELFTLPSGGGPVDGSVALADLDRDGVPEVLWGDSGTTEFHVARADGDDLWSIVTGEVLDAPQAIADVDGDGALDIVLASCGSDASHPGLRAFAGMTGDLLWEAAVGGCYQSAPLLFDQDEDGLVDVVVSTWFDNRVRGFSGLDGSLRWEAEINDWTYHAGSFGDLTGDGIPDVALADYSATLFGLDGATGERLWDTPLEDEVYVFGPTAMGDLDGDGTLEIVVASGRVHVVDARGKVRRSRALPGYCTRGPILVDVDDDGLADVLTPTDDLAVSVRSGRDLSELFSARLPDAPGADEASVNHHAMVADLDGDGANDVFLVYGRGYSDPDPENNWGRAVALSLGGSGPGWPTYSHDHHHSGNYEYPAGAAVNDPEKDDPGPAPDEAADATGGEEGCGCRLGSARSGAWLPAAVLLAARLRSRRHRVPVNAAASKLTAASSPSPRRW